MKFVEKHLNKEHFFHKPHKWFIAFLSSPLHAAEMHYKNKYHLNFGHAKKLFFFDMTLLLSVILLILSSIFWFTYDPTVTSLVRLELSQSTERVGSGGEVFYDIDYANNSDVALQSPIVTIELPEGFIIDEEYTSENFSKETNSFINIPDLAPGASGQVRIAGWLFQTPDTEESITATISYTQSANGRSTSGREERKFTRVHSYTRGSVLTIDINTEDRIISGGTSPATITLKNTGVRAITDITLPLETPDGWKLINTKQEIGNIEGTEWVIEKLEAEEEAVIEGDLIQSNSTVSPSNNISFTPIVDVNRVSIPQSTNVQEVTIVQPRVSVRSEFKTTEALSPGESAELIITVQNNGDVSIVNPTVSIPIESRIISIASLQQKNAGTLRNNLFTISSVHNQALRLLRPGDIVSITVSLPTRTYISSGQDLLLSGKGILNGAVEGVSGQPFSAESESVRIPVGTSISVISEGRYYTNGGDQLGRGPLPPTVGKETKYWAILEIRNTTSRIRNLRLSAKLPQGVTWTGRTSVSQGHPVSYNDDTRTVSWQLLELLPNNSVGINAELSITPDTLDVGKILPLLTNIAVSADDTYIEKSVSGFGRNLDTSIPDDPIGSAKPVQVR